MGHSEAAEAVRPCTSAALPKADVNTPPWLPPLSAITGPSAPQQTGCLLGGAFATATIRGTDCKGRTTTGLALDRDVAPHHLAEPFADRQPKTRPAVLARRGGGSLRKLLEQLVHLLRRHADAGIGNRDRYPIAAALLSLTRIETDGAAISELVGVAHEISTGPGAANSRHSASASTQRCASGRQPVEQRLGFLQIACFKPFGEPTVDGSEQVTGLLSLAPIAP
jgi:hypothetical protein